MLILQSDPARPLTKTINIKVTAEGKEEYAIGQYDTAAMYFSSKNWMPGSFDEMAVTLGELSTDLYSCAIRGALADGTNARYHTRRKVSNKDQGCITDIDNQVVCLDIDNFVCALPPQEAIRYAISLLPPCFSKASVFWQLSASTGFKTSQGIGIHLWYFLDEFTGNDELRAYFNLFNISIEELYGVAKFIDLVMFDSIQIHYTAPPHVINAQDPISPRFGVLRGPTDTVLLSKDWIKDGRLDTEASSRHLKRMGDDKDGFHGPILSASAAWVRKHGTKQNDGFKASVRDAAGRADKSEHSQEQIERYLSDAFLDRLLSSAVAKGFDGPGGGITEEAMLAFSQYVYISTNNNFLRPASGVTMGVNAFDLVMRPVIGMAGASKIFMESGGTKAELAMSLPGYGEGVVTYENKHVYNKWQGRVGTQLTEYDASPWEEHIQYLAGKYADTLMDYIAFVIRSPGKKVTWAPIVGSKHQGIGKSILKIPLAAIFNGCSHEIGTEDLKNPFNSYMESELIFVEEVYGQDNRELANKLKAMITESRVRINTKGEKQYEMPNFTNFMLFTNHRDPIRIDAEDRRIFFSYNEEPPKGQVYYDRLVRWLQGARDIIYSWAHDRDLSNFNAGQAPPSTEIKNEAISEGAPLWVHKLREGIEDISWPMQHDLVTLRDIQAAVKQITGREPNANKLARALIEAGARKVIRMRTPGGTMETVFSTRNHEKYAKAVIADSLQEIKDDMKGKAVGDEREWRTSQRY